jgi:hypothetical protein
MSRWAFVGGIVLMSIAVGQYSRTPPQTALATKFLDSLTTQQRSKALKGFDDTYRTNWRYVPASREGINLGEMTPEQVVLASALLKASLSDSGYKKTEVIKSLEDVLYELENKNAGRDKRLYTFTFFGQPSPKESWGWRYEGHHLSLNFTFKNGVLVSSTPQFFGSNPAEVPSGPQKGLRALPLEQDLGFQILNSMTPDQLKAAVLPGNAPPDIITGNSRKVAIQEKLGVPYSALNASQRKMLMNLVKAYADCHSAQETKRRLGRVEPNSLVFAWIGGTKPGIGHYYRVQGSKFLIEYDNIQNNANHIHAVWRDFDGDFGEDMLAEHYEQSHR